MGIGHGGDPAHGVVAQGGGSVDKYGDTIRISLY
jgi:hypothetical protein